MAQIPRSHLTNLSLFAHELHTGVPLARMPVYAEVAVTAPEELPAAEDGRFDEPIRVAIRDADSACFANSRCRERLRAAVDAAIARLLSPAARDGLAQDPDQVSGFTRRMFRRAREENANAPISGLGDDTLRQRLEAAVRAEAERQELPLNPPPAHIKWRHPLGILGTDHVGYLSFDLTRLPDSVRAALVNAIEARKKDPQAALETAVLVYPTLQEAIRFDALTQGRFAHDAILMKLEMLRPNLPPVVRNLGLLAMQSPGLTDWRLSPASFAGNPGALVGQDGCETMLPANVATQEFEFFQVIRLTNVEPEPSPDERNSVQLGVVHEYRHTWYPLGHSLGQILYSLPLAPGESVNLAVIDWSRQDAAQRDEKTKLNEQLVHNQRRDRTISETVNAAMKEQQSGSSFMAGLAASGGIAGEIGKFGIASGLAGALGGSSSDSNGSRELAASTVQQLGESITQASAAMREMHSTVVVRSTQAEREAIETRTVANYNHSHTLTILYYEVLRHFRTDTRLAHRRPAVLVKGVPFDFGKDDTIIVHRFALEHGLLDERLRPCFEAVDKLICLRAEWDAAKKAGVRSFRFFQFHMEWLTGYDYERTGQLRFALILKNGSSVKLNRVVPAGPEQDEHYGAPFTITRTLDSHQDTGGGYADSYLRPESGGVSYASIKAIRVKFAGHDSQDRMPPYKLGNWVLGALRLHGSHAKGEHLIFDGLLNQYLQVVAGGPPWAEFDIPILSPSDELLWDDSPPGYLDLPEPSRCCYARLRSHIGAYAAYYTRFLWMNEDRDARAQRFEEIQLPGIGTLLDVVENRPLDVIGDYIAFACTHPRWKQLVLEALWQEPTDFDHDERLVTLPTRGVFAEAKLGHCNASEEIDNTRFWDWQKSPIPHFAAQIMPVQAVTPKPEQADVTPTPFPGSLVNIVNPPSAPDPTGLAAALTAISTPGIFRDMSGQQEVAQLLERLSDNTIDIAEAANAAREIKKKQGSAAGGGSGAARANPTQPSAANRDLHDFGKVLKRAIDDNFTTPENAQDLWDDAARDAYPNLQLDFAIDQAAAAVGASALPAKYAEPLKPTRETKLQQALDNARNALAQPLRGRIEKVAITLVDLSVAPAAWAGQHDDDFDFSGSLLKVAAVYAALELRAAARRLARATGITAKPALVSRLKTEFDPQIKAALPKALRNHPKLVARGPTAGQAALLPDYEKVLTVTGAGKVDLEDELNKRLKHLFVDQNQNSDATYAVHLLGYGYIGAALTAAGFFDDTAGKGIWLAGDYSFGLGFPPVKIPCANDGTTAQGTTTRQLARLLALLFRKELFDDPADAQEKVASSGKMLDFMANAGSWFDTTWTQNATAPFRMTQAKVGEGSGQTGMLFSEGGIFHVLASNKDFAIVWQNMTGAQDIPALAGLVKETVETYLMP